MNFEDFWKKIQSVKDEIMLVTLSQKKPFSFSYNHYHDSVDIIPSSKDSRSSQKKNFRQVWDVAKTVRDPYSPSNYSDITFNSSYIVSIIKHLLNEGKLE